MVGNDTIEQQIGGGFKLVLPTIASGGEGIALPIPKKIQFQDRFVLSERSLNRQCRSLLC